MRYPTCGLFAISFIPFTTAWLAESGLATFPLTLYALVFLLVEATYMVLMWESYSHARGSLDSRSRKWLWLRAWIMLAIFLIATVADIFPAFVRLGLLASFLVLHGRPDLSRRGDP